jgi:hypothetical protein
MRRTIRVTELKGSNMSRIARGLALTALATLLVGAAVPAIAHADDAPANRPLTDDVRAELVTAGAVLTGRPASEFGGLREGKTFYAEMPGSGIQFAAVALYANPNEYWAGVQLQDHQNSYMAFTKPGMPGSTWIPTAIGFGPIPAGQEPCPLPQNVRHVWGGPAGQCYPPPAA